MEHCAVKLYQNLILAVVANNKLDNLKEVALNEYDAAMEKLMKGRTTVDFSPIIRKMLVVKSIEKNGDLQDTFQKALLNYMIIYDKFKQ